MLACPAYEQGGDPCRDRTLYWPISPPISPTTASQSWPWAIGSGIARGRRTASGTSSTEHARDVLGVQWCSSIFPDVPPRLDTCIGERLRRGQPSRRRGRLGRRHTREGGSRRDEAGDVCEGRTGVPADHAAGRVLLPQYNIGHLDRVATGRSVGRGTPGAFSSRETPTTVWQWATARSSGELVAARVAHLRTG